MAAFALTDLLVVIAVVAILAGLFLPAGAKTRVVAQTAVELNNVRQIMVASCLYEASNSDRMPHPTWGSIDGTGNGGPDGWAYAVNNNGQLPLWSKYILSAAGKDYNSLQYSNQLEFFKIGQLGPYLKSVQVLNCPQDVAQRQSGIFRKWWLARPLKITSYCMNGTVGGYVPANVGLKGKTYKSPQFKPRDVILWEQNETDGIYFNSGGNNPLTAGEVVTQRHRSSKPYHGNVAVGGGGFVGRVDGSADMMKMQKFLDLVSTKLNPKRKQNEILNGPGFGP